MRRAIESVNERIVSAFHKRTSDIIAKSTNKVPCLIAVSKFKHISSIIEAYDYGQRHFGENYIQELIEKSNSSEILEKCPDIRFHFIGHIQSNKINKLRSIRNLHVIQTIDSIKMANAINKSFSTCDKDNYTMQAEFHSVSPEKMISEVNPVRVMIQVNTSGEEAKSGIEPENAPELAHYITNNCKSLRLIGLMTIGKLEGWGPNERNLDFLRLSEVRDQVANKLGEDASALELSMGMSNDFEEAVKMGSSMVRVGTLIFGNR